MDETRDIGGPIGPPRRAFIASAAIGLSSFVAGLTGCAREEVTVRTADDDDSAAIRKVDPKLIKYRETSKIDTGFTEARNVTVGVGGEDGAIYAVGDNRIAVFDPHGKRIREIPFESQPMCIAHAKHGLLYVGMEDHVEVFEGSGRKLTVWDSLGTNARITAIALDGNDIWVANAGGRIVVRYDTSGREMARVGAKDAAKGYPGLVVPSPHLDVAPAGNGMVFVSNPGMHRIETHTKTGLFQSAWGEPANTVADFCGCCNPTDFALLPDGRFVTSEKGIPRVKRYSRTGAFECVVAAPDSFASSVMGLDLATTRDGRVLVLDPSVKAIRVFSPIEGATA